MTKIINLPRHEYDKVNGTSFWGNTICTSANEICEKLDVDITCYDGDKTTFEFELETENGIPFTLYDWKEWRVYEDTRVYYHIGARNAEDSKAVAEILKSEYGLK